MTIKYSSNRHHWAPESATPNTVTPNGTAWNNSNWADLSAAMNAASVLTSIAVLSMGTLGTTLQYEIDIGVGGAGSEVVIAIIPGAAGGVNYDFWSDGVQQITINIDNIPAGSRLAVRMRKSGTDTSTWMFSAGCIEKPVVGNLTTTAAVPYCAPSAAALVALPAAGSPTAAWTSGAYATLLASASADALLIGYVQDWTGNGVRGEIDIAVGTAGNEAIIHTSKYAAISIPAGPEYAELLIAVDAIPSGSRVAARHRVSTANGIQASALKLHLLNKPI